MELAVQLLLVLAALSSLFQMSHWSFVPRLVLALILSLLAFQMYPWVIEQSKDQLNLWLGDPIKMQNLAVIQMIEVLLFIGIDLSMLKQCFGQPVKKQVKYASFFPGIMLFAVMLYTQMMFFYAFSQVDFGLLGLYFSIGIGLILLLLPQVVKWIIPESYLRLELRYIFGFGQIMVGVIITVFTQRLPYRQQQTGFEISSLLAVIGLAFFMILIGWCWSILKKRIKLKWKF
ncbi:hypothetical protein QQ008_15295 [Fulvivirgaceae bacterium BMA10]|uniref:Uncharacterized protein n=1 Tax=Splendidivirga corallicola TaxID=3051826 RepID=A0ABT8KQQ6_9BACT|nr:hypothetical protein [Fulvivirgaceae bacterium BMA10]